jgi:hypothetical protein
MTNKEPDLSAATTFIWRTARLIDRYRFSYLFLDGEREAVLEALRPYQNLDGGFGNALEPDLRAPLSQPVPVWSALEVLGEVDGFDDPMVRRACDYLMTITKPDGGVPFVLPSARAYPRAPWWETEDDPSGALLPTAGIAALLHKHAIDHRWLTTATEFCWHKIESLEATNPYDMRFILPFLEHVPDRARSEKAFTRIAPKIFEQQLVALDPAAPGDVHTPLNFAPRPDSLARPLFTDEVIEAHLNALAEAQAADGGWFFNWQEWNPTTTLEWRGWVTVDAFKTLRSYRAI